MVKIKETSDFLNTVQIECKMNKVDATECSSLKQN